MPKTVPTLPELPPNTAPYSRVVEAGGLVFLAGQVGTTAAAPVAGDGSFEAEARATFENVGTLLRAVGLDFADVVRCGVFLLEMGDFAAMNAIFREYFPAEPPVRATVGVSGLAGDYRIEVDVIASR